jgi:hypothetical protein
MRLYPFRFVSMAESARPARVGMATLYRNFPGRRELLDRPPWCVVSAGP